MSQEHLELLKKSSILGAIGDEHLVNLSELVLLRTFSAGQVIVREGELGDGAYLISKGAVAITTQGSTASSTSALGFLGQGEVFGEMALLDQHPRSATATATDETTCIFIPAEVFSRLIASDPSVAVAILPVLVRRLRDADRWIQALM